MSLDLRNFVDVNINYNVIMDSANIQTGIVTLITKNPNFTKEIVEDLTTKYVSIFRQSGPNEDGIFYSESQFEEAKKELEINDTSLDKYVRSFFKNKGKGLQIIGGYHQATPAIPVSSYIVDVLKTLSYKFVLITSDADEQDLRKAATTKINTNIAKNPLTNETTVPTFSGLNEKYFISSTTDKSGRVFDNIPEQEEAPEFVISTYYNLDEDGQYVLLQEAPIDWNENYTAYYQLAELPKEFNNYLIKVGEKAIEMLAAAYFSKIRSDVPSSLGAYEFTIEDVSEFPQSVITNNDVGVTLINSHFNFDTNLVNNIRNYPGDSISGVSAVNYYVKILLTQDVTEEIMGLLASKIKFNQSGINRLNNAISQVMNIYIDNGYLNTEYIWTGDDVYITFNNKEYLVCSKNTPFVKGYKCCILPISSLTETQKESHVLPPVYILLADKTDIRTIVINGDIY